MKTEAEAIVRADKLNRTRYLKSRINVKPLKYGNVWVLIGVTNPNFANGCDKCES